MSLCIVEMRSFILFVVCLILHCYLVESGYVMTPGGLRDERCIHEAFEGDLVSESADGTLTSLFLQFHSIFKSQLLN